MNNGINLEWAEKYRPSSLSEILLNDEMRSVFSDYLSKNTIPNMTLYGIHGIGKSSLAKALVNELCKIGRSEDFYCLYLNASDNNNVDFIRSTISDFVSRAVPPGMMKVVIFDEANGLTFSAQQCLKNLIESCSDDTRFILTSNYINDIDPAILSRCMPLNISTTPRAVLSRMIEILKTEGISVTKAEAEGVAKIVKQHFPDIRACVKHLEASCVSGSFKQVEFTSEDKISDLAGKIIKAVESDPIKARELWIKSEESFGADYVALAKAIFNIVPDARGKLVVGRGYVQMASVVDKEIGFFTAMLELWRTREECGNNPK